MFIYTHTKSDRLVAVIRQYNRPETIIVRGKRVSADCKMTKEERQVYVKQGAIAACLILKESRGLSLREAKDLLDTCRFGRLVR